MENIPTSRKADLAALDIAVVLVSVAMLMFEILQMVTLSLQAVERNAFLVVSLCLLGLGGGGSLAAWMGGRRTWAPWPVLWGSALLFGIALAVFGAWSSWLVSLPALILAGVVPYVFAGVFLAFLFKAWPERANRLYFFNLLGSALGCVLLVAVLNGTGDAGLTVLAIAALALLAAVILGARLSARRALAVAAALAVLAGCLPLHSALFRYVPAERKGLAGILNNPEIEAEVLWSKWGYLGRLDVVKPGNGIEKFRPSGPSVRRIMDNGGEVRYLFASGGNWTRAIDFGTNTAYKHQFVRGSLSAAPYELVKQPQVLVIGIGGGVDIFMALQHAAQSVVGVEINPLMIEAVRTETPGYFDGYERDPRVAIREMDGRTFVRNTAGRFDLITLMGVDTGAGLHASARVLSENYLYTDEAMQDYLRVLNPHGFVYVARPHWEMMRILASALTVLRRQGVAHPENHVAILGKGPTARASWRWLLVGKSPLTPEQRKTLYTRYGKQLGYLSGWNKSEKGYRAFIAAFNAGRAKTFWMRSPMNFAPIQDDRPFFYEFGRGLFSSDGSRLLLKILAWVTGVAAVLILLPLRRLKPAGAGAAPLLRALGYFGAIGAGFMFIEICLMQKLALFLGHPAYSVSVTLFSILVFSGLGSMFSARLAPDRRSTAKIVFGAILVAAAFYAVGLGAVLPRLRVEALGWRILLVVACLAPGSFVMGMPFPTMIRLLRGGEESLIPWAWAVNAFMSVIASVLAVLFAMHVGFAWVMALGGACYVLALICYLRRLPEPAAG